MKVKAEIFLLKDDSLLKYADNYYRSNKVILFKEESNIKTHCGNGCFPLSFKYKHHGTDISVKDNLLVVKYKKQEVRYELPSVYALKITLPFNTTFDKECIQVLYSEDAIKEPKIEQKDVSKKDLVDDTQKDTEDKIKPLLETLKKVVEKESKAK